VETNNRLDLFIKSHLSKLPLNFVTYRIGGVNAELCLFCGNQHVGHTVFTYLNRELDTYTNTKTRMCEMCYEEVHVAEMELKDGTSNPRLERIPFADSSLAYRISMYAVDATFDECVHSYYNFTVVLPESILESIWLMFRHCYFCRNLATDQYSLLTVPVHSSTLVSGGMVRSCNSCTKKLQTFEGGISALEARYPEDICKSCNNYYAISESELTNRSYYSDKGKYMCPNCVTKHLYTDPIVADKIILNDAENLFRNVALPCIICDTKYNVDLLSPNNNLYSKSKKSICPDCFFVNVPAITALHIGDNSYRFFSMQDKIFMSCSRPNAKTITIQLTQPISEIIAKLYNLNETTLDLRTF